MVHYCGEFEQDHYCNNSGPVSALFVPIKYTYLMHLQIFTTSIWLYVKHGTWNEMDSWNELMEWTHGMDPWNGLMEWTHGMDSWNGLMEWTHGMDSWN